jgi:hypothetical protein
MLPLWAEIASAIGFSEERKDCGFGLDTGLGTKAVMNAGNATYIDAISHIQAA